MSLFQVPCCFLAEHLVFLFQFPVCKEGNLEMDASEFEFHSFLTTIVDTKMPFPNRFIIGFFLAAIPWYIAAFILLCAKIDPREKPGYITCTIAVSNLQQSFF